MRFLDCVDRREADAVAKLFHANAIWSTASPFGDIQGVADIQIFIQNSLPPRKYGPHYARHRMESAADMNDLTVITPAGERCRFSLETEAVHDGTQIRMLIKKLTREVL